VRWLRCCSHARPPSSLRALVLAAVPRGAVLVPVRD